jgi:hypothetical protein
VTTSLLTSESPLGDILLDERGMPDSSNHPDSEPILQSVIEPEYFESPTAAYQQVDQPQSAWADSFTHADIEAQPSGGQVIYDSVEEFQDAPPTEALTVSDHVEEQPFDFQSPDFATPAFGTSEATLITATETPVEEPTRELRSEESDFEVAETQTMIFASEAPDTAAANEYAQFTASEMWAVQETQAETDVPVSQEAIDDQETGFEFASAAAESAQAVAPPQAEEVQTATAAQETTQSSEQVMQVVEIPETLIDEIVRRVVAQLSENVVREIAWEVVPDCVERIVREMSRDSLQKK